MDVVLALALLRAYKLLISPLFTGCCRFQPSCADYMADAIRTHGSVRGTWLGLRRLGRCHPFGGHGFDPVPANHESGIMNRESSNDEFSRTPDSRFTIHDSRLG